MMMFDELFVTEYIKDAIKSAFKTAEWKKSFGGKTMKFPEENFGESTTFPVVRVEIVDCHQADGTYDTSQEERYTTFWFEVEHFNQAVEKTGENKKQLGIRINQTIVEALRDALNPHITSNTKIESLDPTIYRRLIQGYCNIDNNKKIFYR